MRTRPPLRCVQATAAAATARFRLWTEPAESDYEGSLDFKGRAASFEGTRRASGRVLQTISLPDATFLREPGQRGWMRLHSSRWRQGSWDPFGVLDVVAALPELVPTEPEPTQRGMLQHHHGRLGAEAVAALRRGGLDGDAPRAPAPAGGRRRRGRDLRLARQPPADPPRPISHQPPRAALLHFDLFDFARPVARRDPRALRVGRPRRRPGRPARRGRQRDHRPAGVARSYTGARPLPGGVIGSTPVSGSGSWGSSPCPAASDGPGPGPLLVRDAQACRSRSAGPRAASSTSRRTSPGNTAVPACAARPRRG